jgi:hypothetical protein
VGFIARKFLGEASVDDLKELDDLQKQHPEITEYVRIISVWWNRTGEFGKDIAEEQNLFITNRNTRIKIKSGTFSKKRT